MNASFTSWSGQMTGALQKMFEDWWETLLGDPQRLSDFARRLGDLRPGASASAKDLSKLIEALELLDRRVSKVEDNISELTRNLSSAIALLEKYSKSTAEVSRDKK
jgi:hypothetical protein